MYELEPMLFGVVNALDSFRRMVDVVLSKTIVNAYLNDVAALLKTIT